MRPIKTFFTCLVAVLASMTVEATVNPGEIIIIGMEESNGGGAVQELWFITLAPIDAGEVVYVTDGAFGTSAPFALTLGGKDSYLSFTVGASGLPVGATFIIGNLSKANPSLTTARSSVTTSDITAITSNGSFDLEFGTNGDDLWLYQGSSATSADNFIYAVGCGTSGSQLDPSVTGTSANIATWGLTEGLTCNYFNFGNSNYKLLGVDPNLVDFGGDIDAILTALGNSANYVTDDALTLNSTGTTDLSISGVVPQPSNRYYNPVDGLWYRDASFTTLAADPNRTHNVVVVTTSYSLSSGQTLDVAGVVVGDGSTATTVTAGAGSTIQTVYGVQVTANGTFVMDGDATVTLGSDFDVDAGGTANLLPGAHLDYDGDLIVDGVMTLTADATGFSTLGLHGSGNQTITGTGTINAQMYFANAGWHHLSAPGKIDFSQVSFSNGMSLNFSGSNRNVYRWDPSRSGWFYAQQASNFGDSAYTIYMPASVIPTVATLAYVADEMDDDIVSGVHTYTVSYDAPTGNPVNAATGWATGDATVNAGWNMVKNPYWGHMNWSLVDDNLPSGLNAAVYYWNPSSGSYESWSDGLAGVNYDIPPLMAYFAQATLPANGAAFERSKAAIFDGTKTAFGKVANVKPQMELLASANGQVQSAHLVFDDLSTVNFDGSFDALFRGVNPDRITIATVSSDSTALAIDQRPFPTAQENIYLAFNYAVDGEPITISIDDAYLPASVKAYLEDTETGMVVDLRQANYTFSNDVNAPAQRLILHMSNSSVSMAEFNKEEELSVYSNGMATVMEADLVDGAYHVDMMDMAGRMVYSSMVDFTNGKAEIPFSSNSPMVVRVWNDQTTLAAKVY